MSTIAEPLETSNREEPELSAFLLTYELRETARRELRDAIEELGAWCQCFECTWMVVAIGQTPDGIRARLARHLRADERLLIVRIPAARDAHGWLHGEAWTRIVHDRPITLGPHLSTGPQRRSTL